LFELIRASNYTISLAIYPLLFKLRCLNTGAGTTELLCCMGSNPTVVPYSRPLAVSKVPFKH
jgi:hypothetical protein